MPTSDRQTPAVALDATLWDAPTTGIALYTRELYRALSELEVDLSRVGAERSGEHPRKLASRSLYTVAELPQTLKRVSPDLFHAVANFNLPLVPLPGVGFVLTVHDVIPLLLRESVSRSYYWQFRLWLSRSLSLASQVVCVSETTRQDLLRFHPEAAPKLIVAPNGVDHVERIRAPNPVETAYFHSLHLPSEYVLYAGALDARKNVGLVLSACARLHREGRPVPLLLVGQRWFGAGSVEQEMTRLQADGVQIRALGYLPEALFYKLIREASVFVFPSRYEGFGLPPLEAMWLGTPTVVARAGSLPEVCGEGARYVSPDDAQALASSIDDLLRSPAERAALVEKGRAQARTFTWKRTAEVTREGYRRALAAGRT